MQLADGRPQQAQGDLVQATKVTPDNKPKAEAKTSERLRSAIKGKQKNFYRESKSGRNYIVNSGASFVWIPGMS